MLIPVQQTPIPLDPARQQLTPPPPAEPPPPAPPTEMPVQAGESPQDKFNPQSGNQGGGGQNQAQAGQDNAAAAQKLRVAYARLLQLQQEAGTALQSGNASLAREVASEAAQVAEYIRLTTNSLPVSAIGGIAAAAEQMQMHPLPGSARPEPAIPPDLPEALDTARAGLGTAKTVVETAASLPHHPQPDRMAIDGMRRQVVAAMAGVEAIAAKVAAAFPAPVAAPASQINIRA